MLFKRHAALSLLAALAVFTGCAGASESLPAEAPATSPPAAEAPSPTASASASASPELVPEASTSPTEEAPAPLYRMNEVYRFVPLSDESPSRMVLLTFDDGPKNAEVVTSLLDTLDKHKAKAVFFVNGYRVKQNPELLQTIFDRGHAIGNHSYDHVDLKKEEEQTVREQIESVQRQVEELTGVRPKLFRPPFGSGGETVKRIAADNKLLYMTWSNGSLDWDASARNKPEVVIANVMEQLHPGANILMHELPWTADALDELMGKIEAEGYGFIDPETIESHGQPRD